MRAFPVGMTVLYTSLQESVQWLGYLEQYPDYWTQGETLKDLNAHLRELYEDLSNDRISKARRVAELEVS